MAAEQVTFTTGMFTNKPLSQCLFKLFDGININIRKLDDFCGDNNSNLLLNNIQLCVRINNKIWVFVRIRHT